MNHNERTEVLYFLGGLFPRERDSEIRRMTKSGLQSAANNLQWKFVKGFDLCLDAESVHLLNSEYIGSFPKRYKGIAVPRYEFSHSDSAMGDIGTGFINLPIIKEISRSIRLCAEIDKIRLDATEQVYFVGYAATYPIVKALLHAKHRFPNSVTCLIVPDLPQYMELGKKGPGILRAIKNNVVNREIGLMDCYVPLTAAMAPCLNTEISHCAVVEGIADDSDLADSQQYIDRITERYILYTGTLQYRYGIGELLSAFERIKYDDVHLVICGDGEAADEIRRLQAKDSRIHYMGVLSAEEIACLRAGASVLINPRRNEGEYVKYSFPSKMMEYLASGVPTVAYKLDGIPDDYDGLFIDAGEYGLESAIAYALSMGTEDARQFASHARAFVLKHKGPKSQCDRVLSLLRKEAASIEHL